MAYAEGYNDRLFTPGSLRSFYHLQRFRWFRRLLRKRGLQPSTVIELGCFDGRLLDYLPRTPQRYVGFDAGWEGGLATAKASRTSEGIRFVQSVDPGDLAALPDGAFEIAASLETFEHIKPVLVDAYIDQLSRVVSGYLIVSVPNEKGVPLLLRQVMKAVFSWNDGAQTEKYTARELFYGVLGRMERVARVEHKGFDYAALVRQIGRRFDVVSVEGIPSTLMPVGLCFSVGIVARARPQ